MSAFDANAVQQRIGKTVRAHREGKGLTLEQLASKAGITYQYLSSVENGRENFSIGVLTRLANALAEPLVNLLEQALLPTEARPAPTVNRAYFRPAVPLPGKLTIPSLAKAMDRTQAIVHHINAHLVRQVGKPLQDLIQGNNFSGMVSNLFTDALDHCTSFKHNHHQRYPDLICGKTDAGLEVKATVKVGKGGESHNGHSGWHAVACFAISPQGIEFVHVMFAALEGHTTKRPDWTYVGSRVNNVTGSRRTETYNTTLTGTTKLRDGSVFVDPTRVDHSRWRQARNGAIPAYSIFAA